MAIPDFAAYAQPVQAPSAGAQLESSLRLEKEMQAIEQQHVQAQERVRERQRLQEQFKMQQKLNAHKLAAANLQNLQLAHAYFSHRLADLVYVPKKDRPQAYIRMRQEFEKTGIPVGEMPKTYNNHIERIAEISANSTPAAQSSRKFQEQVLLQELKNRGLRDVATTKAGVQVSPGRKSFEAQEGKENSKYFSTLNTAADNARTIKDDVQGIMGIAGQIPKQLGVVRQGKVYFTAKGQAMNSRMKKMMLDMFGSMTHIGRAGNLMWQTIKQSKLRSGMTYDALRQLANTYEASSNLGIAKNDYATAMKQRGIIDRNALDTGWGTFRNANPMIDAQGNINPQVPLQWAHYFQQNPHVVQNMHPYGQQLPQIVMPGAAPAATQPSSVQPPGVQPVTTGAPSQAPTSPPIVPTTAQAAAPAPVTQATIGGNIPEPSAATARANMNPYYAPNPYDVLPGVTQ